MHVEGATITHHVDRLEQQGLVRRVADPADRRVRRVELTPAGVKLHSRLLRVAKELEEAATAGFSRGERDRLRDALDRIGANVEGYGAVPKTRR